MLWRWRRERELVKSLSGRRLPAPSIVLGANGRWTRVGRPLMHTAATHTLSQQQLIGRWGYTGPPVLTRTRGAAKSQRLASPAIQHQQGASDGQRNKLNRVACNKTSDMNGRNIHATQHIAIQQRMQRIDRLFRCSSGWMGVRCSVGDPCQRSWSPCQNGGTCRSYFHPDGKPDFRCDCPLGTALEFVLVDFRFALVLGSFDVLLVLSSLLKPSTCHLAKCSRPFRHTEAKRSRKSSLGWSDRNLFRRVVGGEEGGKWPFIVRGPTWLGCSAG